MQPSTDGLVQKDTGKHLLLDMTKQGEGYSGIFQPHSKNLTDPDNSNNNTVSFFSLVLS
jgi:hypothetical protein